MVYEYEYDEETQKMRINCLGGLYGDSIEDYSACMATTIDKLMELKKVVRIVFAGTREYEYDFSESKMLLEIALAIERILKERLISLNNVVVAGCEDDAGERYAFLQRLLNDLRFDPIDAYRNLLREIRKARVRAERETDARKRCLEHYISSALLPMAAILDNCRLIQLARPSLTEHKDRSLYRRLFHPTIRPNFIYTRYISLPPANAELMERYKVGDTDIEIYSIPGHVRKLYHIVPPEFKLDEFEYTILDTARRYLGRHEPREAELEQPERIRENLFRIGLDMLRDLAGEREMSEKRLEQLASILARYTAGFGILDLILQDENIQDVEINSPIGSSPIYIFHGVYQECETNIVPSREDGESWATRFRLSSGRPLDEANPVLDTEIEVPGGRARVAAITRTLSPDGLGFAFRRHRDKPWTLPLFINNKMIDSFSAGLLWFLIDGSRTMLVAGTRSSGKTSLLSALMVQIMPKLRIITTEDSVTGDCRIIYERNGKIEKGTVGELIDKSIEKYGCDYDFGRGILRKNPENIRVFSMDKNGKFKLSKVSSFIRHATKKDIYEITTRTGKKIKVTGDHSLFTLGNDGKIIPAKVRNLKIDDYLVTPRAMQFETSGTKDCIDVLEYLEALNRGFFIGPDIKKCINENWEEIKKKVENRSQRSRWRRLGILPIKFVKHFARNSYVFGPDIYYKSGGDALPIPRSIPLTNEFMEFLGLWLADGCYDKNSVIISVVDDKSRECVRNVAKLFGINVKMHSDGISLIVGSSSLKQIMTVAGFSGNAYTKRIPHWIYDLDKVKIASILRGLFSGDGHVSKTEVMLALSSKELIKDVQTLLLSFGIIFRIGSYRERDKTYPGRISALDSFRVFREIGFLQDEKKFKLDTLCSKKSTHDCSDIIPLSLGMKNLINENHYNFNYYDYIKRNNNIGRQKLALISSQIKNGEIASNMEMLAKSDIFWDQIREIRRLENEEGFVYDFSVPECENFVCENILAHNTLEIPVPQLRELGYNIERLKSRSVITNVETELPAEEALRAALRLGDSCLIIGEVRSSIPGWEEVFVVENNETKRIPIETLEDKNIENYKVPTLGFDLKVELKPLAGFVKHPKRDRLLEVVTKTGRRVTVTPDHSLFHATKDFRIAPIECKDLKKGDSVVIPASIPTGFNDMDNLDVVKLLPKFRLENFEPDTRKSIEKLGWKRATEVAGVTSGDIYNYFRTAPNQQINLPIISFENLVREAEIESDLSRLRVTRGTGNSIPALIPVNEDFCRFLGYYVSEGYYSLQEGSGGHVVLTNSNQGMLDDMIGLSHSLFGIQPTTRKVYGAGESTQVKLGSSALAALISRLECGRLCTEKRVPAMIFGLSKSKIASFLRGLFSGDGSFTVTERSGNTISYASTSRKLVEDLSYLLLAFGIVGIIRHYKAKNERSNDIWKLEFKDREMVERFMSEIGFMRDVPSMLIKAWPHTSVNTTKFSKEALKKHLTKYTRKYRHLFRFERCSKNYLKRVVNDPQCEVSEQLKTFANGEFFLDEIKEIKEINLEKPVPVYDLSVEPSQNFIGGFGGILLHNTEALALYEAMRIGALANVVAGTIHGDSAYGVFDRVVNDLGVPPTSFKATDIILIANMLKSPDGLRSFRRCVEMTEVRKHWKNDPVDEGGFVNLLEYSAKDDLLKPTKTLLMGESAVLNDIALRVREWKGSWDAVWNNIKLRSKVMQTLVDYANVNRRLDLLEAENIIKSNSHFHLIGAEVKEELGSMDTTLIYDRWLQWLRKNY